MTHRTPPLFQGERSLAKAVAGATVELTEDGRLEFETGLLPFAVYLQVPWVFFGTIHLTNLRILYCAESTVEISPGGLFSLFLPTVREGRDVSRRTEFLMKVRRILISTRRLHCDFCGKGLETLLPEMESAKRELTHGDLDFLWRELMTHPERCGSFSPAARALMNGVPAPVDGTMIRTPVESVALTLAHELFVCRP